MCLFTNVHINIKKENVNTTNHCRLFVISIWKSHSMYTENNQICQLNQCFFNISSKVGNPIKISVTIPNITGNPCHPQLLYTNIDTFYYSRMSMKGKITTKYPWLDTDFYTNNRTKVNNSNKMVYLDEARIELSECTDINVRNCHTDDFFSCYWHGTQIPTYTTYPPNPV